MRVAVAAEVARGERRVAATPETVAELLAARLDVVVQAGAGRHSHISDQLYSTAGARVMGTVKAESVDILLHVGPLHPAIADRMRPGSVVIGAVEPRRNLAAISAMASRGITSYSLALLSDDYAGEPVDAAGGQQYVSGYRAAIEAARASQHMMNMVFGAWGVVPAAKVVVLGAGLAGLSAADTMRKLGARVSIYDPAEDSHRDIHAAGAVAIDLGTARRTKSVHDGLASYVADADVLICTAGMDSRHPIPPITHTMLSAMRPGSVVVDIDGLVDTCPPGETSQVAIKGGGHADVISLDRPSRDAAATSSKLVAKALAAFTLAIAEDGKCSVLDPESDLGQACVTHDGHVIHDASRRDLMARSIPVNPQTPSAAAKGDTPAKTDTPAGDTAAHETTRAPEVNAAAAPESADPDQDTNVTDLTALESAKEASTS